MRTALMRNEYFIHDREVADNLLLLAMALVFSLTGNIIVSSHIVSFATVWNILN
jgi:hypothetical protein